ncbi:MAG: hypothetical protein K2N06_05410 [Oscillospiraceae bacterium]|nr:hypothetical protein [Oscillospiraceae bacterium]
MNANSKYAFSKADMKRSLMNIDQVFNLLDDKRIDYKKYPEDNLGIVVGDKMFVENGSFVFIDTTLDDLLSLESGYNYKFVVCNSSSDVPYFVGIKPCKKGDFRGEVKYLPPKSIHLMQSVFPDGKKLVPEHVPMTIVNGFYQCILDGIPIAKDFNQLNAELQNASINTCICICLAWEQYFLWRVRVKMPEWGKSVDFNINPADIKSVFKLRDIADGEQRRKALKHIVHSHQRQLKSGEKIEIMRYLRGKEKFTQNGYEITVIPSKDDIKTLSNKI